MDIDDRAVDRLCGLGRLWGAAKFMHPYLGYREDLDWDAALLEAVPQVIAAQSESAFPGAIDRLLARLGDPNTARVAARPPGQRQRPTGRPEPHLLWPAVGTAVLVARDVTQFFAYARQDEFHRACAEAARAEAVIFDLRVVPTAPSCPRGAWARLASWGRCLGVVVERAAGAPLEGLGNSRLAHRPQAPAPGAPMVPAPRSGKPGTAPRRAPLRAPPLGLDAEDCPEP
jgi:hypothetical protein